MTRLLALLLAMAGTAATAAPRLSARLAEVPFCYQCGASRVWPLLSSPLRAGEAVVLSVQRNGAELARAAGGSLTFEHLEITLGSDGKLTVQSTQQGDRATFELRIELRPAAGATESRTITIRPAPAVSPVTYYADFGDDLINIFGAGLGSGVPSLHHELREGGASAGIPPSRGEDTFIRYDKAGFDQYFRRLQCQGVAHEILWLYPFPFITDPTVYGARDWDLYQKQASAILRDPRFTRIMLASKALTDWGLLRDQFPIRADPRIHQAISRSAIEHGIQLGVSYRPFEHAASKYYQLPAFSADGEFLWMFQPLSSPAVNFRASEVGFAHYREILHADATRIELRPATDPETFLRRFRLKRDNLRIVASDYPPIQSDSFVLVRKADGAFRLAPFGEIERAAGARRFEVRNFDVDYQPANGVIVITGLKIPRSFTYLVLDNPSAEAGLTLIYSRPARLLAADGAELGRNAAYFAFPETSPEFKNTRIAGIKPDAAGHAIFFATEASGALLHRTRQNPCLDTSVLVINRGEPYSREMVDYNQPAARRTAIRELRAILRYPAFREIYVNTRSHTALTAELGDGEDGIQPLARYRAEKRPAGQLGIDLAYAPRGAALAGFSAAEIAQPKPGEWKGPCQTPDCTSRWRYARNQAIAQGVRKLLDDIQQSFPGTRLRIVLPERAPVQAALAAVQKQQPEGTVPYTANRNNYISNIGEGLALLDLAGTRFETVLLGVGPFVAPSVLTAFLDAAIPDAEGHRHSSYRGPSGIMYEGQWTLKDEAGRQARERNMCLLLSRPGRISEVIVYEAADWTYRLPWGGFEFLGNCSTSGVTGSRNAQQNAPAK